jgi:hypothetical protein
MTKTTITAVLALGAFAVLGGPDSRRGFERSELRRSARRDLTPSLARAPTDACPSI